MVFRRLIRIAIVCASLAACTARLDISTNPGEPRIVIYGNVTTDYIHHEVNISASTGFFSGESSPGIPGATVSVTVDGEFHHFIESGTDGCYMSAFPFSAKEGEVCVLDVSLDLDGDGVPEVFRASSVVPPSVVIESIGVRESETIRDRFEVLLWGEVPYDEGYYLGFSIARDNGPFNDSLSKLNILEDRYFGTSHLEGLPCFIITQDDDGTKVLPGDMVSMKIDVFPADYGKFLSDAKSEVSGSIPLFSGPPANVGTNIEQISGSYYTNPLGFFGANSTQTAHTVYWESP